MQGERREVMTQYNFNGKTVTAKNYQEAAEKLFGQEYYKDPANRTIQTTYVECHRGYATVKVYKVGDKQGILWGVQAAAPKVYKIERA